MIGLKFDFLSICNSLPKMALLYLTVMQKHWINLNLTVKMYNCRGLNSYKKFYVVNLLSDVDFLFIQEHWLSCSQFSELTVLNLYHYGHYGVGVVWFS